MRIPAAPSTFCVCAGPPPAMAANADRTPHWIVLYFRKWNGMVGVKSRPPPALTETFFSMLAAFASMLVVAGVIRLSPITTSDQNLLLSSFGASAVLLYHEIDAPVTQPTNVLGGTLCRNPRTSMTDGNLTGDQYRP